MTRSFVLGDILQLGRTSSAELQLWLDAADAKLAERVRTESARRGESAAQFLRIAVADFLAEADEESWADMLSAARDAADPGAACVGKMTAFRIRLEAVA
ncbi:MAG TPA: hypothetical protein VEA80_17655 [Vitreimonas sp.]|uniref:hypothetical protein n=1 Tax=Vitreimonas sp. TaxID=3069702 RepID=UPI002D6DDB5A|nr:hypothetical protein [Vitreimonas sp.]HYD89309.1 hypothetical protein [Vitreimonas sp.]